MALVDCPECGHGFSEHAQGCPRCGFPIELLTDGGERSTALTGQRASGGGGYRSTAPAVPQSPPRPAENVTLYAVEAERQFDNSLSGFFHGRTHFWFGLCVYYLGGVTALMAATVTLGQSIVLVIVMGGWAFIGLFLLLWNSKNLGEESSKWIARVVIVLILLMWVGAVVQGS